VVEICINFARRVTVDSPKKEKNENSFYEEFGMAKGYLFVKKKQGNTEADGMFRTGDGWIG